VPILTYLTNHHFRMVVENRREERAKLEGRKRGQPENKEEGSLWKKLEQSEARLQIKRRGYLATTNKVEAGKWKNNKNRLWGRGFMRGRAKSFQKKKRRFVTMLQKKKLRPTSHEDRDPSPETKKPGSMPLNKNKGRKAYVGKEKRAVKGGRTHWTDLHSISTLLKCSVQ